MSENDKKPQAKSAVGGLIAAALPALSQDRSQALLRAIEARIDAPVLASSAARATALNPLLVMRWYDRDATLTPAERGLVEDHISRTADPDAARLRAVLAEWRAIGDALDRTASSYAAHADLATQRHRLLAATVGDAPARDFTTRPRPTDAPTRRRFSLPQWVLVAFGSSIATAVAIVWFLGPAGVADRDPALRNARVGALAPQGDASGQLVAEADGDEGLFAPAARRIGALLGAKPREMTVKLNQECQIESLAVDSGSAMVFRSDEDQLTIVWVSDDRAGDAATGVDPGEAPATFTSVGSQPI